MRTIVAIARNTFLETIRDRILNAILLFAVVLIGASILLGQLSAGQDVKIIKDLGLAAINFFGVIIAIFVGTSLVHKELDKRTVFVVLTKPVPRPAFLLGKLAGLSVTLTVLTGAMGLSYLGLLTLLKVPLHAGMYQAIGLAWLEFQLLTVVTVLFSTFSTPVLCMLHAFAIYLIGHNMATLTELGRKSSPVVRIVIDALQLLLPNLALYDIKNQVVYGFSLPAGQLGWIVGYTLAYGAAVFCLAAAVFSRREF
jgi:ABC-type transport system involved in multi-copper enzyme maturation permease subunit